jgi:hypothetical protein
MNAFDFIKGFLVFAACSALVFGIASSLGTNYGSSQATTLNQLAGQYNVITNYSSNQNSSTVRSMGSQMDNSDPTSQDLSSFFLRGGIEASKSVLGLISLPFSIAAITYNNLSMVVPKIFLDLFIGIIAAGIVIILLTLIMRTRPST